MSHVFFLNYLTFNGLRLFDSTVHQWVGDDCKFKHTYSVFIMQVIYFLFLIVRLEILRALNTRLVKPTLEPGVELTGTVLCLLFKDRVIYVRPSVDPSQPDQVGSFILRGQIVKHSMFEMLFYIFFFIKIILKGIWKFVYNIRVFNYKRPCNLTSFRF